MTKPTTMRRLPQQARGEQRIAAILQAAAQVFYEVGFDAATTDMIAQRAQTAIGSLYGFFPNKEAIAQRLCEQFCEDLRVLFEGILTDELVQVPLSQFIDDILDPLVRYHQTHPGFQGLWLKSQGDPRLARMHQDLTEVLTRKVAWIVARRSPKSDEASALRSSQICIRTVQALLPLAGDEPAIDRQIIAELKTMIRAYLQAVFGEEGHPPEMTHDLSIHSKTEGRPSRRVTMNKQQLLIDPATSYEIVPWMSPVDPQADLAMHGDKYPLESWFVVANLTSGDQKLGFQIHVLVMDTGVGEPMVSVNTSFVNQTTGFYRDQEYTYPLSAIQISRDNLDIRTPDFILKGDLDKIQVRGSIRGVSVEVTVKRTTAVLYASATAHFQWIDVEQFDYALPNMETEGTIEIEGESFAVSGPSWFDRQYGMLPGFFKEGGPKDAMKWLWMNLQLSNGEYFSLIEITEFREKRLTIFATGINDEGAHLLARVNPIEKLDYWKSPVTGQNYPTRFKIQISSLDASFEVTCTPKEQEIVSKLGGVNKYEGAADVTGTYRGEPVTGVTYVEMVGHWS